jgi:hypothetical protein
MPWAAASPMWRASAVAGHGLLLQKDAGEGCSPVREPEHGDPVEPGETASCGLGVTDGSLLEDQLGDVEGEPRPLRGPPLGRELLARGGHQVPAGRARQVADDRGLEVHARLHDPIVPQSRAADHR